MSHWSQTLNLIEPWREAEAKQITYNDLARSISNRIWRQLKPYQDEHIEGQRQELIESFMFAAKNMRLTVKQIDDLMENLYDWGDINIFNDEKVCWIKIL